MTSLVDRLWYGKGRPLWLLTPLTWLYRSIAEKRRRQAWQARGEAIAAPVVVVGNITVGGTGKSPLTAWLVALLKREGWRPVILSRGYGGKASEYPLLVTDNTPAAEAGDEPVMLAGETGCPVVVDPDRRQAAHWALSRDLGNILVCDDGLQHYRLPRDIELAVFDGVRGVGNGALLPVGPLREPLDRLNSVDFVITNGGALTELDSPAQYTMTLEPVELRNIHTGEARPLAVLAGMSVVAVAGIGNPTRFFDTLTALGARVAPRAFPDHHAFTVADLDQDDAECLVMTAKDAVKCRDMAPRDTWVLSVKAAMPADFADAFLARLDECTNTVNSD